MQPPPGRVCRSDRIRIKPRNARRTVGRNPTRRRDGFRTLLRSVIGVGDACRSEPRERAGRAQDRPLVVGSKRFTESYMLGEIVRQTLQRQGIAAEHRQGLGNTGILEQALASGAVDLYPEYTGTIVRELLKRTPIRPIRSFARPAQSLARAARPEGGGAAGLQQHLCAGDARSRAPRRCTSSASPTWPSRRRAGLRLGLSHEFLERGDGWPALKAAYGLIGATPTGLDHGLAYDAVAAGTVDLIDIYSTDAKVGRYRLRVLEGRPRFLPAVRRGAADARRRRRRRRCASSKARSTRQTMIAMNAQVELDGLSFAEVGASASSRRAAIAARLLAALRLLRHPAQRRRRARRAAGLPAAALRARLRAARRAASAARVRLARCSPIAIGVPLGIAAWRWPTQLGLAARRRRGAADRAVARAARVPDRAGRRHRRLCRR